MHAAVREDPQGRRFFRGGTQRTFGGMYKFLGERVGLLGGMQKFLGERLRLSGECRNPDTKYMSPLG